MEIQPKETSIIPAEERFRIGRKWFWIGILVAVFNIYAGLLYGIALVTERAYRREGIIIIAVAVVWVMFGMFVLGPWLVRQGILPQFQIVR